MKHPGLKRNWRKGESGNPAGRPKEAIEFKAWVRSKLADPRNLTKIWARAEKSDYLMRTMLEYGLGKPPQPVEGDVTGTLKIILEHVDQHG